MVTAAPPLLSTPRTWTYADLLKNVLTNEEDIMYWLQNLASSMDCRKCFSSCRIVKRKNSFSCAGRFNCSRFALHTLAPPFPFSWFRHWTSSVQNDGVSGQWYIGGVPEKGARQVSVRDKSFFSKAKLSFEIILRLMYRQQRVTEASIEAKVSQRVGIDWFKLLSRYMRWVFPCPPYHDW